MRRRLLPPPTPAQPSGQVVILKDDKIVEGTVTVIGEKIIVRQGAIDRTLKKDEYFHILRTKLKWGEVVRLPQDTGC